MCRRCRISACRSSVQPACGRPYRTALPRRLVGCRHGASASFGRPGEGTQGHCPNPTRTARRMSALTRRLAATSVLLRSNLVLFQRPDRLVRAMAAALPWGLGSAAGMAAACARYPEINAVIDDDGVLTYGEMWRRSDGVARR